MEHTRTPRRYESLKEFVSCPAIIPTNSPKFLGPDTNHTPERNQHSHDVCHDKLWVKTLSPKKFRAKIIANHFLCWNFIMSLHVPEAKGAHGRRNCLRQTKVGCL